MAKRIKIKGKRAKLRKKLLEKQKPKFELVPRTKLNKALREEFCKLVRTGLAFDAACDYLGIAHSTFHAWKDKGQKWVNGNMEPQEYRIYGRFVLALKRALGEFRLGCTKSLQDPKNPHWVRPLAILSRRDRNNWAEREPQGGATEDTNPDERFL